MDVGCLQHLDGRLIRQVRAETDVDELHRARVPGARVDEQSGLERPERDRDVGVHGHTSDLARVGVDTARHVDRDDHRPVTQRGHDIGRLSPQRARAADAHDAVDDEVSLQC